MVERIRNKTVNTNRQSQLIETQLIKIKFAIAQGHISLEKIQKAIKYFQHQTNSTTRLYKDICLNIYKSITQSVLKLFTNNTPLIRRISSC
ncbi:hypothetical protein BpHYR1_041041 [Brachionus plicatilis]|uniref:Uncharacterized protein n=1 Tax=Brachionus plicatilis TaxID=10195 RepID=A0A3M7PCL3_BRAPC|nr:hypothetical protein BpHYR1_041041 [Brachionus plicatilis]